jgi:hypothetical protein
MVFQRREILQAFGDQLLEYSNRNMRVRVASDRGIWSVVIADADRLPQTWYDAAILRDLLVGPGNNVLSLAEQIGVIEAAWPAIVECFDPAHRADTHARLASLRQSRARRLFPGLYDQDGKLKRWGGGMKPEEPTR